MIATVFGSMMVHTGDADALVSGVTTSLLWMPRQAPHHLPRNPQSCPVDVAAGEAAVGAFLSQPTLRLEECSRWPERQDCRQPCL
jgi:hypothetical protein